MRHEENHWDVVVVGAGSAGCVVAGFLAEVGKQVLVLEAGTLSKAGASWVNGVPHWVFEATGLPSPPEEAVACRNVSFLMKDFRETGGLEIPPTPIWQLHMDVWVRHLQDWARSRGVFFQEQQKVIALEEKKGRVVAITTEQSTEKTVHTRYKAALFVDASGNHAVLRKQHRILSQLCPEPTTPDICTAAQQIHSIPEKSREEAAAFARKHGLKPSQSLSLMGVQGGFSTITLQVHPEKGEVDLLTGSAPLKKGVSGAQLARDFVQGHPWIGEPLKAGRGWIPLRRPYDCFVAPGLALLGNAACQIFPGHASGVAMGCLAARSLANAVASAEDSGQLSTLWAYQSEFQRKWGGTLAGYDRFRKMTQSLSSEEISQLLHSGLMRPRNGWAAMAQQLPTPSVKEILAMSPGVLRAPLLARKVTPVALKMNTIARHYRTFPTQPDGKTLTAWSKRTASLLNTPQEAQRSLLEQLGMNT